MAPCSTMEWKVNVSHVLPTASKMFHLGLMHKGKYRDAGGRRVNRVCVENKDYTNYFDLLPIVATAMARNTDKCVSVSQLKFKDVSSANTRGLMFLIEHCLFERHEHISPYYYRFMSLLLIKWLGFFLCLIHI